MGGIILLTNFMHCEYYVAQILKTYFTLGHSSHTVSWVIWNRPGPSCVVLISCLQLHFLLPGASLATGLLRTTFTTVQVWKISLVTCKYPRMDRAMRYYLNGTISTKAWLDKPRQSFQSRPPREWPPGLEWCRFLWGCFCPAAVGCLQTWSQSHQRSYTNTANESIKISLHY